MVQVDAERVENSERSPGAALADALDNALLDIVGELGAALIQQCATDDKIIMDHVRNAHEQAKSARRLISLNRNGATQ